MGILGIIFGQNRSSIGSISIDATITEEHTSNCDITENPVENGTTVSDHVQLKPKTLRIEGIITDTPLGYPILQNIQGVIRTVQDLFGKDSRSIDAFNKLLELQKTREPFEVITGLKKYDNMILKELSVPRNANTGRAILFTATMQQIVFAESQTGASQNLNTSVSGIASNVVDAGKQTTSAVPSTDPNNLSNPKKGGLYGLNDAIRKAFGE